jgi:hypothetical protein
MVLWRFLLHMPHFLLGKPIQDLHHTLIGERGYQITFSSVQTVALQGAITQCSNILQLGDHSQRAVDDAFWSLLNAAIGQSVAPY